MCTTRAPIATQADGVVGGAGRRRATGTTGRSWPARWRAGRSPPRRGRAIETRSSAVQQRARARSRGGPREELGVDGPQLDQQQRHGGRAGDDVQPLGDPVAPDRAGRERRASGSGVWAQWLTSPVTNATPKQMPSQSADPGGDRGAAQPRGEVALVGDRRGVITRAALEDGEPAAAVLVRGGARPGRPRRRRGRSRRRRRPPTGTAGCGRARSRAGPCRVRTPVPGRREVDHHAAVRREQLAQPPSSATGSPPMPMLPSASSAVSQRPSPGSGSKTSRVQRRHAAVAGLARPPRGPRRCPSTSGPRAARCRGSSGPGRSRCRASGPAQCASTARSEASASRVQRVDRQRAAARRGRPRRTAAAQRRGEDVGERRSASGVDGHAVTVRARRAANRPSRRQPRPRRRRRRRCRRRAASAAVPTRRPAASQGRPGVGAGVGRRHRHVAQRRAPRRGRAAPSTHQPPSSAGPSTASWSPSPSATARQVGGGDLRGVHADLDDRARRRRRRRGRWPAARRSRCPRCGATVQPARPRRELAPRDGVGEVAVEGEVAASGRRPRRRRRACRAAPRRRRSAARVHADRRRRAGSSPGRRPGPWRSPAPGRRLTRSTRQKSRAVRDACRAPSRTPSTGCPAARGW